MNGKKTLPLVLALVAGCAAIIAALLIFGRFGFKEPEDKEVEAVVWDAEIGGVRYKQKPLLKVLLIVSEADMSDPKNPVSAGRDAAAMALISFDENSRSYSVLSIDPDTYFRFRPLTDGYAGEDGYRTDRIGHTMSFGSSLDVNCLNVTTAVGSLLYSLDIPYYICINAADANVSGGRIDHPEKLLADFCKRILDNQGETAAEGAQDVNSMWLAMNASTASLSGFASMLADFTMTDRTVPEYDRIDADVRLVSVREESRRAICTKLYYERVITNE